MKIFIGMLYTLLPEGGNLYVNDGRANFYDASAEFGLLQPTVPYTGFGTEWFDYDNVKSMRKEARQKLSRIRPATIGQATRISGVSPSDIGILLVWLRRGGTT